MRYLVLSDIHANLEALDAALEAGAEADAVLVLGDLVGYGADPNAVIDRVRALSSATVIRGNHDKVGTGLDSVESFNQLARYAIEWTAAALTPDRREWLAALPRGPAIVDDLVEICHGSPVDEDAYILSEVDAQEAIDAARRPLCFFGHTHVPAVFVRNGGSRAVGPRGARFELTLEHDARYLVNCGAVGQPRDGDGRAAFGLLDTQAWHLTIVRTAYDVEAAQAKIIAAGLPDVLAHRLSVGR